MTAMTSAREAVLEAIRGGAATRRDILRASGVNIHDLRPSLSVLLEDGKIGVDGDSFFRL